MLMGSGRSGARLLYNSRIFFFLLLPLLQYSQAIVYVDKNFFSSFSLDGGEGIGGFSVVQKVRRGSV